MDKRPGLPRTIPFGLFIGFMALDPILRGILPVGFDPRWTYAFRVLVAALALAVLWKNLPELRGFRSAGWSDWGQGLGLGILVFILWVNLDFPPLTLGTARGFDPRDDGSLSWGLVATRLAGAALVVPVMEELFWRSFILRWLQHSNFLSVSPGRTGTRALVISSVLFATEHHLWFAGILAGLAYGLAYKRTGNLWVPIVSHAVTNLLLGAYVLRTGEWSFW